MKTQYIQEGNALDYINNGATTIEAGDIVPLTGRAGIAAAPIDPGAMGTIHVAGVFEVPKGAEAFAQGEPVCWDSESQTAIRISEENSTQISLGWVAQTAAASAQTLHVKLC